MLTLKEMALKIFAARVTWYGDNGSCEVEFDGTTYASSKTVVLEQLEKALMELMNGLKIDREAQTLDMDGIVYDVVVTQHDDHFEAVAQVDGEDAGVAIQWPNGLNNEWFATAGFGNDMYHVLAAQIRANLGG